MKKIQLRNIGIIFFIVGILAGFLINTLAVWADFEASLFQAAIPGDEGFAGLQCPILMGKDQEGFIYASVRNPSDKTIEPNIRVNITEGSMLMMRELDEKVKVDPGESVKLSWLIKGDDAAWDRFVAFRLYQFRSYPEPSRAASCGVYVVNLPRVDGTMLTIVLYGLSLFGMGFGIWAWKKTHQPLQKATRDIFAAMIFLAVTITCGLAVNLFGLYLLGALFLIMALLAVAVILAYLFSQV